MGFPLLAAAFFLAALRATMPGRRGIHCAGLPEVALVAPLPAIEDADTEEEAPGKTEKAPFSKGSDAARHNAGTSTMGTRAARAAGATGRRPLGMERHERAGMVAKGRCELRLGANLSRNLA